MIRPTRRAVFQSAPTPVGVETRLRADVKKCECWAKGLSTALRGRKVEAWSEPLSFLYVFQIITNAKVVPR